MFVNLLRRAGPALAAVERFSMPTVAAVAKKAPRSD